MTNKALVEQLMYDGMLGSVMPAQTMNSLLVTHLIKNGFIKKDEYVADVEQLRDETVYRLTTESGHRIGKQRAQAIQAELNLHINAIKEAGVSAHCYIKDGEETNAPPDSDSDSYVREYPNHFIFINKKTGKETKVDK